MNGASMLYQDLQGQPLVSTENKAVVFLHIPKTAGTTFNEVLYRQFNFQSRCPWPLMRSQFPDFSRYDLFYGHFYLNVIQFLIKRPAVYISFFRNPIERSISHYYQVLRGYQQSPEIAPNYPQSIEDFVDDYTYYPHILDLQTRTLGTKLTFSTYDDLQNALIINEQTFRDGYRIKAEDVYPIVDSLDFIGITEEFNKSMVILTHTLGWKPIDMISSKNIGHYPKPSQTVINKIIDLNQEDLKLYDYVVKVFNERFNQTLKALNRLFYITTKANVTPRRTHIYQSSIEASNDDWHNPETTPQGVDFTWSAQNRASVQLAIASGEDLELSFHVIGYMTIDIIDSISVTVNETPIPLSRRLSLENTFEFSGIIPKSAISAQRYFSEITFHTSDVVRPIDLDPTNLDERTLGIALSWLNIKPVKALASRAVALTTEQMRATIKLNVPNRVVTSGTAHYLNVRIDNPSSEHWSSIGHPSGAYAIQLGLYWINNTGQLMPDNPIYTDLPHDIEPNTILTFQLLVTMPASPGEYLLCLNLVQCTNEGDMRWFVSAPVVQSIVVEG